MCGCFPIKLKSELCMIFIHYNELFSFSIFSTVKKCNHHLSLIGCKINKTSSGPIGHSFADSWYIEMEGCNKDGHAGIF